MVSRTISSDSVVSEVAPTLEEQRQFYDQKWSEPPPSLHPAEKKRVEFIRSRLAQAKQASGGDLRILDFGCGRGLYSSIAAEWGDVEAIDLSPRAIELAKHRFPGPKYQVASVYEYENDMPFDIVMSLEVLEHLEDQASYVMKCGELLRPGGELLLTMPNRRAARKYWAAPLRVETRQPIENWLTPKELEQLLSPWFEILSHSTHNARYSRQGVMRIVNSTRLNSFLSKRQIENPLRRYYEKCGLGVFQFVHARRKSFGADRD